MPTISLQSRIQRRADVLSADVNGQIVLMNATSEEYYELNPVASDIWRRLTQPILVADLVSQLAEIYDTSLDVISADVQSMLETLTDMNLLILEI